MPYFNLGVLNIMLALFKSGGFSLKYKLTFILVINSDHTQAKEK